MPVEYSARWMCNEKEEIKIDEFPLFFPQTGSNWRCNLKKHSDQLLQHITSGKETESVRFIANPLALSSGEELCSPGSLGLDACTVDENTHFYIESCIYIIPRLLSLAVKTRWNNNSELFALLQFTPLSNQNRERDAKK